ncbi:hypothetical protein BDY24DRAFT_404767 [Mrakia frigida]|uniref:NUDIX hydrolase n=1 Tax=Mrakia frigida TaxID=29902 RepID=UPI003FCBFC3C
MAALDPTSAGIRNRQTQQATAALPSATSTSSGTSLLPDLLRALEHIQTTPPRQIASPPTQQGRASVAICIRLVPSSTTTSSDVDEVPATSLEEFFARDWVREEGTTVEILYIRRAKRRGDRWSSQLAFPGGRKNAEDENAQYTALRETWEEVGIDLAEQTWLNIGQLDDREITTSLGKRLLMVLSPFVFLQTTKTSPEPELDPEEVSTLHWIPLDLLVPPITWSTISISLSPRIARNVFIRRFVHLWVGSMQFSAISLPDTPTATAAGWKPDASLSPEVEAGGDASWLPFDLPWTQRSTPGLRLWGLTLGMTLDLTSLFQPSNLLANTSPSTSLNPPLFSTPPPSPDPTARPPPVQVVSSFVDPIGGLPKKDEAFPGGYPSPKKGKGKGKGGKEKKLRTGRSLNAGTVSVLPSFSFPDVDFFVWVFGRRYRRIIRSWDESVDSPGAASRRINWSGAALSAFYSSVRKALLCAIILRAISTVVSLALVVWWVWRWRSGSSV